MASESCVLALAPKSKKLSKLSSRDKFHPSLKINLPKKLKYRQFSENLLKENFDLIVIALSLSGIDLIGQELKKLKIKTPILVLTKCLKYEKKSNRILTISEQLKKVSGTKNISVLKGPCLAKELARKNQTSVVIAIRVLILQRKLEREFLQNIILLNFQKM